MANHIKNLIVNLPEGDSFERTLLAFLVGYIGTKTVKSVLNNVLTDKEKENFFTPNANEGEWSPEIAEAMRSA